MQAHKPCKAVTVEDSFKSCTSLGAAATVLGVLAPDLLLRLQEEFQVGGLLVHVHSKDSVDPPSSFSCADVLLADDKALGLRAIGN